MRRFTRPLLILPLLLVVTAMMLGGCAAQDPPPPPDGNDEPQLIETAIIVYFADDQAEFLVGETRYLVSDEPLDAESIAAGIIDELIEGPEQEGLFATIPEGTRLLDLEIVDGTAMVDLSEELKTRHVGGSAGETMTLTSIVNSLTELEEIEEVQLLIEGQVEDTLAGHWYIGEPLQRNPEMIR